MTAFEPSGANEALDKHAVNNLLQVFFRDSLGMEMILKASSIPPGQVSARRGCMTEGLP